MNKMKRWEKKVAVVTGASSGIGACLVENLVSQGMKVAGLARNTNKLADIKKRTDSGQFYPIKCDLVKENDIVMAFKKIEEEIGPISVIVNNAGVLCNESIIDGKTENFQNLLNVNVLAVTICIREATRSMRKYKLQGHIININSVAGHDAKVKVPVSIYPATKYAITGLTESLRVELQNEDPSIKVTSISPGTVRTDMIRSNFDIPDDVFENLQLLEPQDVVDAIIYALSTPPHVQINELILKNVKEP